MAIKYEDLELKNFGTWRIKGQMARKVFTAFLKDNFCGRGEYAEEIDISAENSGQAKNIAEVLIGTYYEPDLRVGKVLRSY